MYLKLHAVLLAAVPVLRVAHAATHDIDVGKGGNVYDPESLQAAQGDLLRFHFYPAEHNVAQGPYDQPCQPTAGGIFSGDIEVEGGVSDKVFNVIVNNTDPIWIYCSESNHCPDGMAMVVNPAPDQDLAQYKRGAQSARPADPSALGGGVFAKADEGTSSSSISASDSTSTSITSASVTRSSTVSASPAAATSGAADRLKQGNSGWMVALGVGGAAVVGGII